MQEGFRYPTISQLPCHLPKSRTSVATADPRISNNIMVGVSFSSTVIEALRSSSVSPPSSVRLSRFRRPWDLPPLGPPSARVAVAALWSASTERLDFFRGPTPPPDMADERLTGASPGSFLALAADFSAGEGCRRLCGVTLTPLQKTRTPLPPEPACPLAYVETAALLREPPARDIPIFDLPGKVHVGGSRGGGCSGWRILSREGSPRTSN